MPKVVSYTPSWLSKPSPGHDIFVGSVESGLPSSIASGRRSRKPGPRRVVARRGTEVFVAVGKEIRWADLVYLKEAWDDKERRQKGNKNGSRDDDENQFTDDHAQGYRTIKTPVADNIRQLVISPNSNFIAVLTTHTVHIMVLPEPSHLTASDTGAMRLKTYTLGPTTHVTSQPAISSALWHPLGVNGSCLVTITEDAVVRTWELSVADRWSFDRPTLAIDLKKLADGTSLDQDYGASVTGANNSFSPDSFEMEVASACFPSGGSGGWAPMTLWIAMREGDVYALCPLLPEKFAPPPTLIPSLSVSIVAKVAAMEDDQEVASATKLLAQQQLSWMSDLDNQDPVHIEGTLGEPDSEVYTRPSKPGRVPKLQGPFDLELEPEESEDDLDNLFSDIFVIGPKIDSEELMFGEDEELEMEETDQEGLSVGVVCLLTSSGRVSICLDLDGVEAQWLPKTTKGLRFTEDLDCPSLLTFQVLDTSRSGETWEGSWPMFSPDISSRYSFFITDTSTVTFISLAPWAFRLETELSESTAGTDFRIDVLVKSQGSTRERIFTQKLDQTAPFSASSVIQDPDLGYFLLTTMSHGPLSLTFEAPEDEFELVRGSRSPTYEYESEPEKPLVLIEPRPVYQPSHALQDKSSMPVFLEKLRQSSHKRLLREEVRMSPTTLKIMTDAHRILSEETFRIGTAAAELFRRCVRLQVELRDQIRKANEVAARVESLTGEDSDDEMAGGMNEQIENRLHSARDRQEEISGRLEALRKKIAKVKTRELSDKERAWSDEVTTLQGKILGGDEEKALTSATGRKAKEPYVRFEEVRSLKEELLDQVEEVTQSRSVEEVDLPVTPTKSGMQVPASIRTAKMAQVLGLLDRETALVEGAKSRLERLNLV